jgi:predicted dehydrogenase
MYASSVLLRRIMEEGWFGPCHRISVSEGSHVTRTGMDSTPKGEDHRRGGGITLNIGCHLIDLALHLTGATAYSIVETNPVWDGACDRKMAARIRLENIHGRDGEHCELAFAVSWLDQLDNRIDLEFEHVTVSAGIVPDARVTLRGSNDTHPGGVLSLPGPGAETFHQAFFLEWQAFLRGLERNEPSLISASSGRLTTRLIEQLLREGAPA